MSALRVKAAAARPITRAALRSENPGIEWHTLGGHLADSVPFWVSAGAGIPGGYTQRDPCPHRGAG